MGLLGLHLPKKVNDFIGGVGADINLWDGGKSHSNPNGDPRGRGLLSRAYDQVMPFDNGRTWSNANPTNNRSILGQATHNGLTNLVGDFAVKPIVSTALLPMYGARLGAASITGNNEAWNNAAPSASAYWHQSIPGFFADQGVNAAKTLGNVAPTVWGEVTNNPELTNRSGAAGMRAFNNTVVGQMVRPAAYGISNLLGIGAQDQAYNGLDPNATGAQKWFADPVMGTVGTVGMVAGGKGIVEHPNFRAAVQTGKDIMSKPSQKVTVRGRVNLDEQGALQSVSDYYHNVPGSKANLNDVNRTLQAARDLEKKYNVDLHSGSAMDIATRANALLDQLGKPTRRFTPLNESGRVQVGSPLIPIPTKLIDKMKGSSWANPGDAPVSTPKVRVTTKKVVDTFKENKSRVQEQIAQAKAAAEAPQPGKPFVKVAGKTETPMVKVKKTLIDRDALILDQLKAMDKANPVPKGQPTRVQEFMYNSNMQRGSNATANEHISVSTNVQDAIGGMSKREYKSFSDYANAKAELAKAGKLQKATGKKKVKVSRPVEELKAIVKEGEAKYGERFTALNSHYKELAKMWYDAGMLPKKKYEAYKRNNSYIHIQRDMGDLVTQNSQGKGNGFGLGSTVARFRYKGSKRETVDTGQTMLQRTQQVHREIARNRTGTQLVDNLLQHGLAEKVSAQKAQHQNVVRIFRDGKKEYYKVSADMKKAMDNISPYQMDIVMRVLAAPGRLLRAGVTGLNPVFIARNLVKDQVGSAINSPHMAATHNPRTFFEGIFNATADAVGASKNKNYQMFKEHYGDITSYDLARNTKSSKEMVDRIRGGKKVGVAQAVKHPIRSLENLASITEKSTRYQNFIGEYRKAIKEGATPEAAKQRAAISAWQNSADFARSGEWGRVINTVLPYWNPATQGARQMVRTFHDRPVKSVVAGVATVGVPMAASTAWNLSNPDTKKIYDNIPEYEKDNNLILIPPGTKQNKDGSYDIWKIPLPPGYKDVFMPIRRSMEAFAHDKPAEGTQFAQDVLQAFSGPVNLQSGGQFLGSFVPQAAKPIVQQAMNKDLFTGKEIVPGYINDAQDANGNAIPENKKAYKHGSGTAQAIGDALGVSPIRVEKAIKDTAGTVGLNVLNASDNMFTPDKVGGQSIPAGFKRSFFSTQGIKNYNASEGQKYYDSLQEVQKSLNNNEKAAFQALHPDTKNFLGDKIYIKEAVYDPAARLDIYNRFPKVYQADKAMDTKSRSEGKPGNPMFDLEGWQLKKVLEKENLPPGAADPELSNLWKQDWYNEYRTKKTEFFSKLKQQATKDGKQFGDQSNPYPDTPPEIQRVMDTYNAIPKGTGARSSWIKANPAAWNAMQQQFAKVDNWQNIQRGKRGLDFTEGQAGVQAGYGSSGGSGGYGSGKAKVYSAEDYRKKYTVGGGNITKSGSKSKATVSIKAKPRSTGKVSVRSAKIRLA